MVRAMAGRHATLELATRGSVVLKGLPGSRPGGRGALGALPEARRRVSSCRSPAGWSATSAESLFAFFGRADELRPSSPAQRDRLQRGPLGVVLVSGEPGIGKTTLVAKAARAAHAAGSSVLYGGAEEDLAIPYRPWVAALTPLVDPSQADPRAVSSRRTAWPLPAWCPHWRGSIGEEAPAAVADADAERFMMMEGAVRLLAAYRTTPFSSCWTTSTGPTPPASSCCVIWSDPPGGHARHRGRDLPRQRPLPGRTRWPRCSQTSAGSRRCSASSSRRAGGGGDHRPAGGGGRPRR